jgi:hypothetical protein
MRVTLLWFCIGLAACARHAIRCDAHLQAINQAALASESLRTPPTVPAPTGTVHSDRSSP